jgi:hypothetical protein
VPNLGSESLVRASCESTMCVQLQIASRVLMVVAISDKEAERASNAALASRGAKLIRDPLGLIAAPNVDATPFVGLRKAGWLSGKVPAYEQVEDDLRRALRV